MNIGDNFGVTSYAWQSNIPNRLSLKDINRLMVTKSINTEQAARKREVKINYNSVNKLSDFEYKYQMRVLEKGVYKPRLSYKMLDRNSGYIILYNVNMFKDKDGIIKIPEGVSVICCNEQIECLKIKFPKSLSCIISLNLKSKDRVHLRNVKYLSNFVVDSKEVVLPYTLQRIEHNGLTLLGNTILKSEKTSRDTKINMGSLGQNAIIDNRENKSSICISNRFCNAYVNSLPTNSNFFLEVNCEDCILIDDMFISNYYPSYLYT